MIERRYTAAGLAKFAVAISVISLSALGFLLANTDNALQSSFQTALMDRSNSASKNFTTSAIRPVAHRSVAASEDFWLGHAARSGATPVAWTDALRIGDQVTVSTKGVERVLQVVRIDAFPVGITKVDTRTGPGSTSIVTAREVGKADGLIMRFVMETRAGPLDPQVSVKAARNL